MDTQIIVEGKRRRNWPKALKRRIVEESNAPGVSVCDVARGHDLDPAQLFAWRKMFRERSLASAFVSVDVEDRAPAVIDEEVAPAPSPDRIEIALVNGRRLFAPARIDPKLLSRLVAVLDHA